MNLQINSIEVKNFMGIACGSLNFKHDNTIVGKSGSGKSTFRNAFLWAFNQNVDNYIPMIKRDGELTKEVILDIDIMVEVNFNVNGFNYILKRFAKHDTSVDPITFEKKYRGTSANSFMLNDIKYNSNQINEQLENILGIKIEELPIFLSTNYFMSTFQKDINTTNKARREFLLRNIAEEVNKLDTQLLMKEEYSYIRDNIAIHTIDEMSTILNNTANEINANKNKNKTLYANNQAKINELKQVDVKSIQNQVMMLENEKERYENLLNNTKETNINNELENRINELKLKLTQSNLDYNNRKNEHEKLLMNKNIEINNVINEGNKIKIEIKNNENIISNLELKNKNLNNEEAQYKIDYELYAHDIENLKSKEFSESTICPFCNQPLPQNKIDSMIEKFNYTKNLEIDRVQQKIKNINEKSNNNKLDIINNQEMINQKKEINNELNNKLNNFRDEYLKLKEEYEKLYAIKIEDNESNAIMKEILTLQNEINVKSTNSFVEEYKAKINEITNSIDKLNKELEVVTIIDYLENENKKIIDNNLDLADMEQINKQRISAIKNYNKEKMSQLANVVSDIFPKEIKWVLYDFKPKAKEEFNQYVEICEPSYLGKMYSTLSSGEKNQANYLIQLGLQKMNNVELPIWLEDYELNQRELFEIEQQRIVIRNDNTTELNVVKI